MWLTTVFFILLILSLLTIVVIVVRKLAPLRLIDPTTIAKEQRRKVKEELILQRFSRFGQKNMKGVSKMTGSAVGAASKIGRRAVQKLYAIEQYYQKLQKMTGEQESLDSTTIKRLLEEADKLAKEDEFIQAEKRYIEIISHNPKHTEAYEHLGNLYIRAKRYKQARETFLFVLRLSPEDASVFMSLGELARAQEDFQGALQWFTKAVDKRNKNPKYLDAYIEMSLKVKSHKDAAKGIRLLEAVNPDNKKLTEFKKQLDELNSPT